MLTLIAARDRNGAIGRNGEIPWQVPEDLAFFQRETCGGAVIMGRLTWESLPARPLKNRLNLIVSRTADAASGAGGICRSPEAALDAARSAGHMRIYGIGGAAVYHALMPLARRLLITEIGLDISGADTFFPGFDNAAWQEADRIELRQSGPKATLRELLRR